MNKPHPHPQNVKACISEGRKPKRGKLTLKNNEMEAYNFEAMMKKQEEYEAKAERRKIDFFMQELSQEGQKYLREKIMRSEPNHHYLGTCEAYTNLGLGYEEVRKMKTGKYKLELKKITIKK